MTGMAHGAAIVHSSSSQAGIGSAGLGSALKSFTNALSADAKGACARDIHRHLIESSDFLGCPRSRADMASQTAEFFCGVISMGITTPQYILKRFARTTVFAIARYYHFLANPAAPLHS
jgi:hypothetical protein